MVGVIGAGAPGAAAAHYLDIAGEPTWNVLILRNIDPLLTVQIKEAGWMAEWLGHRTVIRRSRVQFPTHEVRQLLSEGHVAMGVL